MTLTVEIANEQRQVGREPPEANTIETEIMKEVRQHGVINCAEGNSKVTMKKNRTFYFIKAASLKCGGHKLVRRRSSAKLEATKKAVQLFVKEGEWMIMDHLF